MTSHGGAAASEPPLHPRRLRQRGRRCVDVHAPTSPADASNNQWVYDLPGETPASNLKAARTAESLAYASNVVRRYISTEGFSAGAGPE